MFCYVKETFPILYTWSNKNWKQPLRENFENSYSQILKIQRELTYSCQKFLINSCEKGLA